MSAAVCAAGLLPARVQNVAVDDETVLSRSGAGGLIHNKFNFGAGQFSSSAAHPFQSISYCRPFAIQNRSNSTRASIVGRADKELFVQTPRPQDCGVNSSRSSLLR